MKVEGYVLKYPSGHFVAIDQASGGYPYDVKDLCSADVWSVRESAEKYSLTFKQSNFTVHEVYVN